MRVFSAFSTENPKRNVHFIVSKSLNGLIGLEVVQLVILVNCLILRAGIQFTVFGVKYICDNNTVNLTC